MKLTIETENPAEIVSILAALTGGTTAAAPATPRASKKETPTAPEHAAVSAKTADPAPQAAQAQTSTAATSPSDVPDEATLTAAANAAIGKLGPGAQAKIKQHIADNFQKDDGTPAGLRTVQVGQRATLLADLQAFANGSRTI